VNACVMCVSVSMRKGESVCVCVFVCSKEREREMEACLTFALSYIEHHDEHDNKSLNCHV